MDIYQATLSLYRKGRVPCKRAVGLAPTISTTQGIDNEYHGNEGYGGWAIPAGVLRSDSTVVEVGLGEDSSFSESLIARHSCGVHGFDPTPKSIDYVQNCNPANFHLHPMGVAGSSRTATRSSPSSTPVGRPDHQEAPVQMAAKRGRQPCTPTGHARPASQATHNTEQGTPWRS